MTHTPPRQVLTADEVVWGEPPSLDVERANRRLWQVVVSKLKSRPGVWALVSNSASDLALYGRIRRGVGPWKPIGAFDLTTRVIDGRWHLWVRFNEPDDPNGRSR